MARDYLEIGSGPADESCAQVGTDGYRELAMLECRQFIKALRKKLGDEPEGANLSIKSNPHEFGTYYEVVCYYDDNVEAAIDYAFACESSGPTTWEEVGMIAPTLEQATSSD